MKAALLHEPLKVSIEEIEIPACGPHEVLVEVKSCGVCATDVKKFTGSSKAPFLPFILGHEPAGVVSTIGGAFRGNLKVGDRVAISPVIVCGSCHGCKSGLTSREGMGMCENYEVLGFSINGAFTEFIVCDPRNITEIPDALSFQDAALIEPVAACANGVLRSLTTPPGNAVVLGAGFMGLVSMQLLKLLGARVLIADLLDDRLELARAMGADETVNPHAEDLEEKVKVFSGQRGAESIICAVGNKGLTESAITMLARGGKIVLLASAGHNTTVEFNLNALHYSQSIITGSVSYTDATYAWSIELLAHGALRTEGLITSVGKLDRVQEFMEMTRDQSGIKKVIVF